MNKKVAVPVLSGVFVLVVGVLLLLNFLPSLRGGAAQGTPALKVNGTTVTREQLEAIKTRNPVLGSATSGPLGDDFKTLIIDQQIRDTLIGAASADQKIERSVVNAQVTETRSKNNLTENKAWTDALRGAGFSDSSYREYLRTQLAIQAKAKAIQASAPKPTEAQLQLYYQLNAQTFRSDPRIVAREIVVATKARADQLLTQLRGGADFAKLAAANSLENKERGGAIGPLENGAPRPVAQVALPTEVGAAAFVRTTGGLTEVVSSGGKFYIVKVENFLPAAPKPFAEVRAAVSDAVGTELKNQALENWVDGLKKNVKVESVSPDWKYNNPVVATVGTQDIPYAEVVTGVVSNQQFSALLQQQTAEQVAPLVNSFLKPGIVQQLTQQYAAPAIVKAQNLPLVGNRAGLLAGLNAYGARDAKVSDADVQAFYAGNQKNFQTTAKATVSEAVFANKQQALVFRQEFKSGDFTALASKAGATVSERGSVTAGDKKLNDALDRAVFAANRLQAAGEGSLSDVTDTSGRYSLAYVSDLVKASVRPLSEVRTSIYDQLLAQKKQAAATAYVAAQMKTVKTQDLLAQVLAAQTKRLAAEAPKATTPTAPAGSATPATPTTTPATPAGNK
ncbi:peptidyl-prolyl cis-trans isomerase [Deinococcus sp.]|uniref:peptidylprolyl isomerase n=1 Tax=Deinococcus sp. TaxID=47478 RepID=UPI00286E589D|nr:peptidyl-prolyl cis-trans isomerase [Deinococcus sp.]